MDSNQTSSVKNGSLYVYALLSSVLQLRTSKLPTLYLSSPLIPSHPPLPPLQPAKFHLQPKFSTSPASPPTLWDNLDPKDISPSIAPNHHYRPPLELLLHPHPQLPGAETNTTPLDDRAWISRSPIPYQKLQHPGLGQRREWVVLLLCQE